MRKAYDPKGLYIYCPVEFIVRQKEVICKAIYQITRGHITYACDNTATHANQFGSPIKNENTANPWKPHVAS